jgi:hypothetical protein
MCESEFLGEPVRPASWLPGSGVRFLILGEPDTPQCREWLREAGVTDEQILVPPADGDDSLDAFVETHFPDPIRALIAGAHRGAHAFRVGVFGTGAAAVKTWEAIADLEEAEVVWFADNNPRMQGQKLLWLDVIEPAQIPHRAYDAVVVGSMSRQPIQQQLLALGVPAAHIWTPDVQSSVDSIRAALSENLRGRRRYGRAA